MKKAFITGADRGIGFAICQKFLKEGWQVFAGRFMDNWKELDELKEKYPSELILVSIDVSKKESVYAAAEYVKAQTENIDMLINCAGIGVDDSPAMILKMYQVNTLGAICVVEAFLPLMEKGLRRICCVSSEAGSISVAHRKDSYGYCMSKAALNMAVRLMFQELQPQGFTFRLYHPGWVNSYMEGNEKTTEGTYEPEDTAIVAFKTFTQEREWEDVLVMTDIEEEMWPF